MEIIPNIFHLTMFATPTELVWQKLLTKVYWKEIRTKTIDHLFSPEDFMQVCKSMLQFGQAILLALGNI